MLIEFALIPVAGLLAVSLAAILAGGRPSISAPVYGASAILCALVAITGLAAMLGGGVSTTVLPVGLPWLGAHFRLDALAGFFLVVVGLGGAVASLYAIGYGRHEREPWRVLPFYSAFLGAMSLVVLADDAFSFLVSWEVMSLLSWALVLAHHRENENRRAGYVYLMMAGFGTMALLLAFGLLSGGSGGYAFDAMRETARTPAIAAAILALVLIGAGSKAGLVPLHVWLPLAHPAAPSHVSALMSGVMTKVAIYGFIRIVFDLVGLPSWWAAMVVLVLGGATAALGVLYALMQHDLKRLLAYHTVENIGIIFIGLGLALAFQSNHQTAGAALAFTAALFHVFNHSLFKSLLFFGSGAVLTATGERDMEHLGGLIHRMPATSIAFLIGCVAISALPPLNGFVSEWLTFQAILISPELPQWGLKLSIPTVGALLALSAALAAACFVKAYGITFLGRPRSKAAERAAEVDRFALSAMFILAGLCVLAGIFPGFVIDALAPAVASLVGGQMPTQTAVPWLSIVPIAESRSSYNGLLVFIFIAASATIAALAIHRLASRAFRRSDPWDCGFPSADPATQYTAGSFAQPIRRVFGTLVFAAREKVEMPPPGDTGPARLHVTLRDLIWDWLYQPVAIGVTVAATRLNALQFLTIRRYLALVFATLVLLLMVLALWS
ncbi:MAG: hydrogenase 4 subunit B [Salaquimonas sp.]|nr:hydrogenase 4 subunit B [Salaquimonas sp.]